MYATAARSDGIRSLPEGSTNASQTRKKGMILPFEPLSITFDNIKYSVDMPQVTGCICFRL